MTFNQCMEACRQNKYLIFTDAFGFKYGVNGGILNMVTRRKTRLKDGEDSRFVSFFGCGLEEYIQHKVPFIKSYY